MRAVELTTYDQPGTGLHIVDNIEPRKPGEDEALIAMEYAPVHQTDLLVIRGLFSIRPKLPSPIGNQGVGRIVAVGASVTNVKIGDRVVPPLYSLTWREKLLAKASELIALPEDADVQQLAMLRINPITAALLLSEHVALNSGDWVIQNAGTSGVGRSVAAIGKARGLRIISLVRSNEKIADAIDAGADAAFVDDTKAAAGIAEVTNGEPIRLALDAVGGHAAGSLIEKLSAGATLVGYGIMGGNPMSTINVLDLIYKDIAYRGFYQARQQYDHLIPGLLQESAKLITVGKLKIPVSAVYPIEQIEAAVEHVQRGGTVLLKLTADD